MTYPKCLICNETLYEWRLPHKCKPAWQCCIKDWNDEQEPPTFYSDAIDHQQAAKEFAARHFQGEGREWEVWVRKNTEDTWQKFSVTVEAVPSFTATPIT